MVILSFDGADIVLSDHAALRYHERVRPTLPSLDAVIEELVKVAQACAHLGAEPPWVNSRADEVPRDTDKWVWLTEDIVFPVKGGVAMTCLTRGSLSDEARRDRAKIRRHSSQIRRGMRMGRGVKASDRGSGMKQLEEQGR